MGFYQDVEEDIKDDALEPFLARIVGNFFPVRNQ